MPFALAQNVAAGAADAMQSWSYPHALPPLDEDDVLDVDVDDELVEPLLLEVEDDEPPDEVEPPEELVDDDVVSSLLHAASEASEAKEARTTAAT